MIAAADGEFFSVVHEHVRALNLIDMTEIHQITVVGLAETDWRKLGLQSGQGAVPVLITVCKPDPCVVLGGFQRVNILIQDGKLPSAYF